jgi:hypothetical protein
MKTYKITTDLLQPLGFKKGNFIDSLMNDEQEFNGKKFKLSEIINKYPTFFELQLTETEKILEDILRNDFDIIDREPFIWDWTGGNFPKIITIKAYKTGNVFSINDDCMGGIIREFVITGNEKMFASAKIEYINGDKEIININEI